MKKVESLSEILICTNPECFVHPNICLEDSFQKIHHGHLYTVFKDSKQYTYFKQIAQLDGILRKKISKALQIFNNVNAILLYQAVLNSNLLTQIFKNSFQAKCEYLSLRQLDEGRAVFLPSGLTYELYEGLTFFDRNSFRSGLRLILRDSKEWQFLNKQFSLSSGSDAQELEIFIAKEQSYFSTYISEVIESKRLFSIREYIAERKVNAMIESPTYFTSQFMNFLIDKYTEDVQNQCVFTSMEYYLNFWKYFAILLQKSQSLVKVIESEIGSYFDYMKVIEELSVEESLLGFRMWKATQGASPLQSIENSFFISTFVCNWIEKLIEDKALEIQTKQTWREFAICLQQYVQFSEKREEPFSLEESRDYFQFRKISKPFEELLQKKNDIVFNNDYFLEYLQKEFKDGKNLSVKKYNAYQQERQHREAARLTKLKEITAELREVMKIEEKEKFYEVVFNNYLETSFSAKKQPTKEEYIKFKAQILLIFDEDYLREDNENYLLSLQENEKDEEEDEKKDGKKDEKGEKKGEDDEYETLGNKFKEEDEDDECPCCFGNPYDCKQPVCIAMNCCTTCMLG